MPHGVDYSYGMQPPAVPGFGPMGYGAPAAAGAYQQQLPQRGYGAPRAYEPQARGAPSGTGSGARGPPGANLYLNNLDPNVIEADVSPHCSRHSHLLSSTHACALTKLSTPRFPPCFPRSCE
jgi:hypothetical protein